MELKDFTSNNMDSPSYTDIKKFYDVNLSDRRLKKIQEKLEAIDAQRMILDQRAQVLVWERDRINGRT